MSTEHSRPLAGKRIVVTRARGQASSLVTALTELGAEVIELPTIEIVPLESYEALDDALRHISRYQWLIVTSANTVRVLAERLTALGLDTAVISGLRKVAIGSATARAMRQHGVEVDIVPEQYVAESLIAAMEASVLYPNANAGHPDDQREEESLPSAKSNQASKSLPQSPKETPAPISGSRILLARAAVARDAIPEELRRRRAIVDVADAYRTAIPGGAVHRLREVFSDVSRPPDGVTFTSASTVKNFFALWKEAGHSGGPEGVAAISIGPITSETLREHGWQPTAEAEQHDAAGLVAAALHLLG